MFTKDAFWLLIPLIGLLWGLGGSGYKLLRRLGAPLTVSTLLFCYGVPAIISIISGLLLHGTTILPYGNGIRNRLARYYIPYLYLLGLAYGASSISACYYTSNWFIFMVNCILCMGVFGSFTILSQKVKWFEWKFAEILTGMSIGLSYSFILKEVV